MGWGIALGRCGVGLDNQDTDVKDNLSLSICNDRIYDCLREGFNGLTAAKRLQAAADAAYPALSCKGEKIGELFKPLLFGLVLLTKRFRVSCDVKVLVHEHRDEVQVLPFERRKPFVYDKFNLTGLGHWVGAIGGELGRLKGNFLIIWRQVRPLYT